MNGQTFSAAGKLLLFGEYFVLRGTPAIVMPVRFRQSLHVTPSPSENIYWECFERNKSWLQVTMSPTLDILTTTGKAEAKTVQHLLRLIKEARPGVKIPGNHFRFEIDFNRNLGLGTSATLISLLSQWSGADPYFLLEHTFGGSGFDVAAATQPTTFIYQRSNDAGRQANTAVSIKINGNVTGKILFIYSGKKQQSLREVASFKNMAVSQAQLQEMRDIVADVRDCSTIEIFESLMAQSEQLLSNILAVNPVKKEFFPDYPYEVKSLGAWGGDFLMATFRDETEARKYFTGKGMAPIFNYEQLIRK